MSARPGRPDRFLAIAAVAVLSTACSDQSERSGPTTTSTPPVACAPATGEKYTKALLRCTERSVVRVENELSSGTGVVVASGDDRFVLTNLHVVDPFGAADVTTGGETIEDVPVAGVDALADIALVGPLEGDDLPAPLPLSDGRDLERGDDVYLVGFPGETADDDLEATISSGIVSRLRTLEEFDQHYIQTDASIAGGQSGGPLFDERGRLVGISGLSFAEEFALALSGADVRASIEKIAGGDGDAFLDLPTDADAAEGATSGSLRFHDAGITHTLLIPRSAEDRTLRFVADPAARPLVAITDAVGEEPLAISLETGAVQQELAERIAARNGGEPEELPDLDALGDDPKLQAAQVAPGSFEVDVPRDASAFVSVSVPLADGATEVSWTSNLPLVTVTRPIEERTVEVGDELDLVLGPDGVGLDLLVELAADQRVLVNVRSPQGDPGFAFIAPSVPLDAVTLSSFGGVEGFEQVDDTDDGLYGLDARKVMEAGEVGLHRIRVYNNELATITARVSIVDCETDSEACDG